MTGSLWSTGGAGCSIATPSGKARTNPRYHNTRAEAVRQAGRLADEEGAAVFVMEQTAEGGRYRLLRERLPR